MAFGSGRPELTVATPRLENGAAMRRRPPQTRGRHRGREREGGGGRRGRGGEGGRRAAPPHCLHVRESERGGGRREQDKTEEIRRSERKRESELIRST